MMHLLCIPLSDREIVNMVLNIEKDFNSSNDDDIVNTDKKKIIIDYLVKMCYQLITGLE